MPALALPPRSLERVRELIEGRSLRISGRIGEDLAACFSRPGKMIRGRFCLLLGAALGVEAGDAEHTACAAEFIHTASLLHDDCVDGAALRRGRPTPNRLYGRSTALLLGDLACSQGFEEAAEISHQAMQSLASTVREMAIGELQEEFLRGSVEVTLEAYLGIASRKTGALFEWCGAVLSELSPHEHTRADPARLASSAGILLQMIDDIQDWTLKEKISGKDKGQDFKTGRLTLPAILALNDPASGPRFQRLWQSAQGEGGRRRILKFLQDSGHLQGAKNKAQDTVLSMLTWTRSLPCRQEARALEALIESMSLREF